MLLIVTNPGDGYTIVALYVPAVPQSRWTPKVPDTFAGPLVIVLTILRLPRSRLIALATVTVTVAFFVIVAGLPVMTGVAHVYPVMPVNALSVPVHALP